MKWAHIIRIALVLVITLTTFSGAALTAQAAGPRPPQRYEQQDDHWKHWQKERERDQRRWEKNHKSSSQKEVDRANRKANIAIGVAAVATVIALSK
ncbi:hypothetical protein [Megasphaera elsdenii]|uniref:hypothetical protein n=1 Tax=Megasphaera elsdenii TaxID=907 RepID=UPI0033949D0B|nr:hypothetical protein [Caecibacter massiliensis]MCI6751237.1 hypothetical protein [Megasphaera elsdenii]